MNMWKTTALVSAMSLTLSACSWFTDTSENPEHTTHNNPPSTIVTSTSQVQVYAMSTNDTLSLKKLDGTIVAKTVLSDDGIKFEQIQSMPDNTPLIASVVAADGQVKLQAIYAAGELSKGVSITPMTTLLAHLIQEQKDKDIVDSRNEYLAKMQRLGMIDTEWSAISSKVFDNDVLNTYLNNPNNESVKQFVAQVKQDIQQNNVSVATMQAGFPKAHGGMQTINNRLQNNVVAQFDDGIVALNVEGQNIDQSKITYSLKNAPSWAKIQDNMLVYTLSKAPNVSGEVELTVVASMTNVQVPKEQKIKFYIAPMTELLSGTLGPAGVR